MRLFGRQLSPWLLGAWGVATLLLLAGCGSSADATATVAAAEQVSAEPDAAAEQAAAEPEPEADPAAEQVAAEPEPEADPATVEPEPDPDAAAESATDPDGEPAVDNDGLYPVVLDATATTTDGVSWRVNVTLSSEYDSPERYADAWRVLDADGNELGVRVLTHDHANEQPFTRSHTVDIAEDIDAVFIEGRDQRNGWAGELFELTLTR